MKRYSKVIVSTLLVAAVLCASLALFAACPPPIEDFIENNIAYAYDYDEENGVRAVYFICDDYSVMDCVVPSHVSHDGVEYVVTGFYDYYDGPLVENGYVGKLQLPATFKYFDLTHFENENLSFLREIVVEEGNPYISSSDGVLYSADKTEMLHFPVARDKADFCLPRETRFIPQDSGMYSCTSLQSVTVESGNETYRSYDGLLYSELGSRLDFCPLGRKEIKIKLSDEVRSFSRKVILPRNAELELAANPYLQLQEGALLNTESDVLYFAVAPDGKFAIPDGVKIVAPNALAQTTEVFVPSSVTVFWDCYPSVPSNLRLYFESDELPLYYRLDFYAQVNFRYSRQLFDALMAAK